MAGIEMNYSKLTRMNLLNNRMLELLDVGAYYIDSETQKITPSRLSEPHRTPWIQVKPEPKNHCGFWHHVLFNIYDLLPIGCLDCYKVVVRPTTLKELVQIETMMINLDHPCKLGVETRSYVKGLYSGYFYNRSLGAGLECLEMVKKAVAEAISPDIEITLKRGCTEFERKFGPSGKWDELIPDDQAGHEGFICNWIDHPNGTSRQPLPVQVLTRKTWIEFAYEHGDETYKEFHDGMDLYEPYVRYGEETANESVGNDSVGDADSMCL
ncbi:MAG: hypothetical protein ACYTEQ_18960 [Planctomycetota bacterium]|jgi:hypothetical protein